MTAEKSFHRIRITARRQLGSSLALGWKRDFEFSPGQLAELAFEEGGPSRLYSLFTGPGEDEAGILFNVVEGGELTPDLGRLGPGDELWFCGPSGSFPALSGPGVWIANGTGVAPFVSMARAGLAGEKTLVHGARVPDDFYFHPELEGLLGEAYVRCCSCAGPDSPGETRPYPGRLTAFLESRDWNPALTYELCGSASMVVDVRDLLIKKGIPHPRIISEVYF